MSKLSDAAFVGNPAAYTDAEWERACVLDKGEQHVTPKDRWALPVREPDGTLNAHALREATAAIPAAEVHELAKDAARRRVQKRCLKAGVPVTVTVTKARLSYKQRKNLPASAFVFPKTREYPIPDAAHARDALSRGAANEAGKRLAKIRAAVKRRFPDIKVSKQETVQRVVPVWKDEDRRLVYGVVLTPDLMDSQGDVVSAEDIEKAAHAYLVNSRKHDVQHSENPAAVETVESYVAPDDMTVAGQPVAKGSWVIGVHVPDPEIWQRVYKGQLTGFSIGGSGVRVAA
ncbi:MAG: XkdF-like putative serine protease domain-containing protein [Acidiferrobacteraceae bacterium]